MKTLEKRQREIVDRLSDHDCKGPECKSCLEAIEEVDKIEDEAQEILEERKKTLKFYGRREGDVLEDEDGEYFWVVGEDKMEKIYL